MFTIRTASVGASALLAFTWHTAATGQDTRSQDWYVGFSGDATHVEVFRGVNWESGEDEPGLSLRGGLRLRRRFGVEFAAQHAGDLAWTEHFTSVAGYPGIYDASASFDVKALEASAVGFLPFGGIFEGILKGGLAHYDLSGRRVLDDAFSTLVLSDSISDRGFGYLIGLGLGVQATPRWRVRVEYQFFDIEKDFLSAVYAEDASVDTFRIGVDYRLGRSER